MVLFIVVVLCWILTPKNLQDSRIQFIQSHSVEIYFTMSELYEVRAKKSEQRVCIGMEYDSKPGKPKGNGKPKAALSLSFLICIYK